MKEFALTIALGNDAMQSPEDVALSLRKVAAILYDDTPPEAGRIRDDNGNVVGWWAFA